MRHIEFRPGLNRSADWLPLRLMPTAILRDWRRANERERPPGFPSSPIWMAGVRGNGPGAESSC